ncbi:eukaryotic translation initiation factor 4B2 [Impatiens glandulifera]|uniref:eukaryotic translation initiation factor 4B2 n=1 Tax=Impatiens glandulifera TaxID=253017 RepID=UPI001FB0CD7A|nr:eukaryotic translation initiation factor 4B2 [Impatiens glandulifera]
MSKSWGAITSWAAEAEAEEQEQAAAAAASSADSQSFPSLKEAVSTKQKKKKMTLQEFTMGTRPPPPVLGRRDSSSDHKGLTPDEMMRLPTGPKERSPDEMQYGRMGGGGGFSTYGRSGGFPARRDREDSSGGGGGDGDTSWGGGGGGRRSYGGGFDEDRRQPPPLHRASDFDQPSRADEVDNWAMAKKPLQSYDSGPTRPPNRYGSLGAGEGMSRADEVDSWAAGKKPIPASAARYSSSTTTSSSTTFGASTFRNTGPEPERWSSGERVDQERPKLVLQARSEAAAVSDAPKANKPSPFGAARPREEVLAEKGLDWKKIDLEIDAKKTSRPTSSQSSRPSSAQSNRSEGQGLQGGGVVEGASKQRPKVNPFGDAKPRELLLEEKGMDWRKIDLGLEEYHGGGGGGVGRSESDAEKNLKKEIDNLKKELEKVSAPNGNGEAQLVGSVEQKKIKKELEDLIVSKEKELEVLMNDLDGKVLSGQKHVERPGSGAGRVSGIPERPPSQSGRYEESRNVAAAAFIDRPRSRGRGGGDAWTRQSDDRRSFRGGGGGGGRETGFLGNSRDMDRSRERW